MINQKHNPIKYCIDCGHELVLDTNWTEASQSISQYICKSCNNKRCATWRDVDPIRTKEIQRKASKKFRESEKGKEYTEKWLDTHPDYKKDWIKAHPESVDYNNNYQKDYRKTKKGKNVRRKASRKSNAKRKGYDYIELFDNPFQGDIPVVWHHISDAFVIALPRSLHKDHGHGRNVQLHRNELQQYVESIYNITYIIKNGGE